MRAAPAGSAHVWLIGAMVFITLVVLWAAWRDAVRQDAEDDARELARKHLRDRSP